MRTLILLVMLHATSLAAPSRSVTNPRELMVEAIDAPDGSAHGVLTGETAGAIARGFATDAPLRIDVTTLKRYSQEGCRRLNVAFSQDGVRLPGAASRGAQRVDFGIDYCRDGRAPASRKEELQ